MGIAYGSYTFPNTFSVANISNANASSIARLPKSDMNSVVAKYKAERRVHIRGTLVKNNLLGASVTLRTQTDALKAALNVTPANLYLYSDRFFRNACVLSAPEDYEPRGNDRYVDLDIEFACPDPFYYVTPEVSDLTNAVAATPYTKVLTAAGNVYALPTIALTCTAGTIILTLTNTTNGQACRIETPIGSGHIITIDSLNAQVLVNGAANLAVFDGMFPRLEVGANSLTLTYSGATVTNFAAHWFTRYL